MARPEIVCITVEFEGGKDQGEEKRHHGAQPGLQRKFVNKVMSLVTTTIDEMGNPFLEDSHDLLALDTRNIMHASVVDSIINFESLGLEQRRKFVKERFQNLLKPVTEKLPKNYLPLLSSPSASSSSKEKVQLAASKKNC